MNNNLTERDSLYISGLLHDIGKFIERAKKEEWQSDAKIYLETKDESISTSTNYAHRRYSAVLVDKFKDKKRFLNDKIKSLVLFHHKGDDSTKADYQEMQKTILVKLLRIADDLASSEREDDKSLEPQEYFKAKILSPFRDVKVDNKKIDDDYYLELKKLSTKRDALFPDCDLCKNPSSEYNEYQESNIVQEFIDEFEKINSDDELLALMEKYLVTVPAQTPTDFSNYRFKPDVNLFDHSKMTSAIALCLYDQWGKGELTENQILNEYNPKNLPDWKHCLLISGDLSGIKDFIFRVKTDEKVAQSLKGRSFFVQLISEVCAKYIVDKLELKQANILYNGGGNFFILAPKCREEKLKECRKDISEKLLAENIYLALGWTDVSFSQFKNFSEVWKNANNEVKKQKMKKFSEIGIQIFEPFEQKKDDVKLYEELTQELIEAKSYSIIQYEGKTQEGWRRIFSELGYEIRFNEPNKGILFNDTDFVGKAQGFRFAVNKLPQQDSKIIGFDDLGKSAESRTGTKKLGVLKMDIDDLGKIFQKGLSDKQNTVSRITSISRSLKWFLEGYVNTLIEDEKFKNELYVIFSGGDDLFLVGAWDKVFEFAIKVREEFNNFVCNHPAITLSASLLVVDPKFPVARFSKLAEERLREAKDKSESKNSISIFDEVLSWSDFGEVVTLKNTLYEMIVKYNEPRAIIEKVKRSSIGFEKLQDKASKEGKISMQKVWRLAYYLRDVGKSSKQTEDQQAKCKELAKKLVEQYEKLIFFSTINGKKVNPMIFPISARWAEFATRNKT